MNTSTHSVIPAGVFITRAAEETFDLGRQVGEQIACRAVGLANGTNPIPIVIPCHRVIGSNGKLTGYGGGLPIKEKLLALEARQLRLL